MDKRLLSDTVDEHVKVLVDPSEAIKLVRRLRRVSFFLRISSDLITERDEEAETYRCYDLSDNVQVPARQAIKILTRWVEFNEHKAEQGKPTGQIWVTRLGNCLFIG